MEKLNIKKVVIILIHALIGWALCGAAMFILWHGAPPENVSIGSKCVLADLAHPGSYGFHRSLAIECRLQDRMSAPAGGTIFVGKGRSDRFGPCFRQYELVFVFSL